MKNYYGEDDVRAIILAAGEGRRLRPLTNDVPKAMVKLFGMSLLERQINTFRNCNINDIVIVGGYNDEMINFPNIKKYKNTKFSSTNMVESLFCAKNELSETVIVSYGDIIFEKKVLNDLINSDEELSVVIDKNWKKYWNVRFADPLKDAESLKIDSLENILEIGQSVNNINEIEGQYIGLMKFQGKSLEFIKKFYENMQEQARKSGRNPLNPKVPFRESYMTDFIQGLINVGCKIKAVSIINGWFELDNNDDYRIYNKMYRDGNLSDFIKLEN